MKKNKENKILGAIVKSLLVVLIAGFFVLGRSHLVTARESSERRMMLGEGSEYANLVYDNEGNVDYGLISMLENNEPNELQETQGIVDYGNGVVTSVAGSDVMGLNEANEGAASGEAYNTTEEVGQASTYTGETAEYTGETAYATNALSIENGETTTLSNINIETGESNEAVDNHVIWSNGVQHGTYVDDDWLTPYDSESSESTTATA